jgi:tetratricopeptide (TPR) repeat protein
MPFNPQKICVRQLQAAEGYIALNMPDHALRELDQIENIGNHAFNASMLRGEALLLKLDHHQALDAYRRAHFEKPTDLGPLLRMAWCLKRIDQLPQAIDTMKLAYQFHKGVPLVLYNMACYYALAGDKENALSWLARSLRMDREYLNKIAEETDFDSLRNDPDFQHLLELTSNQNQ